MLKEQREKRGLKANRPAITKMRTIKVPGERNERTNAENDKNFKERLERERKSGGWCRTLNGGRVCDGVIVKEGGTARGGTSLKR